MTQAALRVEEGSFQKERRQAILRAARKVFESKGLEGASIRLIAKEAGCTTGSIYPYFNGKEEIYAELLSRSLDHYKKTLLAGIGKAMTPKARFEAALISHFAFYEKRPSDMSLALYLFNGLKPQGLTSELNARLNEQFTSIIGIFVDCVQELTKGHRRTAETEVGLHIAMLFGLLTLHHTKRTRVLGMDARSLLDLHIRQWETRLKD